MTKQKQSFLDIVNPTDHYPNKSSEPACANIPICVSYLAYPNYKNGKTNCSVKIRAIKNYDYVKYQSYH